MNDNSSNSYSPFAPLLIRISVGTYFMLLGIWGFLEPELSRQAVHRYAAFSAGVTGAYVAIGVYFYFSVGLLVFIGFYTKYASVIGALLILPLLHGAGAFSPVGEPLAYFLEKRSLFREVVVLASCLSLSISGAGALSLEGMIRGLSGRSID